MRNSLCVVVAAALPFSVMAQTSSPSPRVQEYTVDAGHSIVEFSIGFALSRVKGRFTGNKGTILYDEANPANSSVTFVIESKTIDTGWAHRDEHLRTSDFFDVAKYPTIVYQSDRIRKSAGGWLADGKLIMHGVTKQVTIPFRFRPPVRSAESNWMMLNLEGGLRLARADFGIFGGSAFNSWFNKARAATMSDSVDVNLEIEAYRIDGKSQISPRIESMVARMRANGVQSVVDTFAVLKKGVPADQFASYVQPADIITRALLATGRISEAVKFSRAFSDLFPGSTRALMVRGFALAVSGDSRGAAGAYAAAKNAFVPTQVDPNEKFPQDDANWFWLDLLAKNGVEWGFADRTVAMAKTISELYPQIARAHTTLGFALAASGDARGAAAAYARALEIDPNETRALELRRTLTARGVGR